MSITKIGSLFIKEGIGVRELRRINRDIIKPLLTRGNSPTSHAYDIDAMYQIDKALGRLNYRDISSTKAQALARQLRVRGVDQPRAIRLKTQISHKTPIELGLSEHEAKQYDKLLRQITGMHELDELKLIKTKAVREAKRGIDTSFTSHAHPEVLLREHNILSTLDDTIPIKVKGAVGQYYKNLRSGTELTNINKLLQQLGTEYGEGVKLNRSARKHLSPMLADLVK